MTAGADVTILDGGLATLLQARGHDLSGPLWSAGVLAREPAAVRAAHAAYVRAGATVVTTASYQVSRAGCAAVGLDAHDTAVLLRRSVHLAREAAATAPGVRVAASVGPYGAALADGSEYRGRYGLSVAALRDWHAWRLEVLLEAGPDLLALETIPDLDEAAALLDLVRDCGVPAWLSYTVEGERTRAGQPLAEAFAATAGAAGIVAAGVNCCDPGDVEPALLVRGEVGGPAGIAYPNRGEAWDARRRRWVRRPGGRPTIAALAPGWIRAGAAFVGGCCRVGPADIAALASAVAGRAAGS